MVNASGARVVAFGKYGNSFKINLKLILIKLNNDSWCGWHDQHSARFGTSSAGTRPSHTLHGIFKSLMTNLNEILNNLN